MTNPTMVKCEKGICGLRVRLEGGDIAGEWHPRAGNVAWCELTVSEQRDTSGEYRGHYVSAYGGEVWPSAWPHLFANRGHGYGRWIEVTDEGKQLLGIS